MLAQHSEPSGRANRTVRRANRQHRRRGREITASCATIARQMADSTFVSHEASARLILFAAILGLLILWERWAVARTARIFSGRRWPANFAMGVLDTLILRSIFPAGAVGA